MATKNTWDVKSKGDAVRFEGGRKLKKGLKDAGVALDDLKAPGYKAAMLVRDDAARRASVEKDSGRFIASLRAVGTQYGGKVVGGGRAAPHFVVREFGGTIPRAGGGRTKAKERSAKLGRGNAGYFLWPAFRDLKPEVGSLYAAEVEKIVKRHLGG